MSRIKKEGMLNRNKITLRLLEPLLSAANLAGKLLIHRCVTARTDLMSILLTFLMFGACFLVVDHSFALDAPHDPTSSVSVACVNCHPARGSTPSWMTAGLNDITLADNLCFQCHNETKLGASNPAALVQTHSLYRTSGETTNGWVMECKVCHHPHYQKQATFYSDGSIVQGVVSSATFSLLVVSSPALTAGAYAGYVVIPNTAYPNFIYRIKDNTANTIYIQIDTNGQYGIAPANAAPGSTFAIKYGKMIKEEFVTPNSGTRAVKFFNNQGPNSFATSSTTVDGVCQVCHTRTGSYTNTGTLEGTDHPSLKTGTDCTVCHQHTSGFKADCGICHGNPPLLSSSGGPDGLANNEGGTGSLTPGAHNKHAVTLGYVCDTCHTGGMPASMVYDKKLQIGFSIAGGAYQSGSYDGRTSLANGYTYTQGNAGTTVTTGGSKVCSNVYCHGATMAPNGGTDTSPVWDNPSTASCGFCHGATAANPPTRGSHSKHALAYLNGYSYPCGLCHRDPATDTSLHVNGKSEVVFSANPATSGGSYSGTDTVLDANGTCTNVYCHSTVQSSPPGGQPIYRVTPTWGNNNSLGCSGCHLYFGAAYPPMTGSHARHLDYPDLQECDACHNYNNTDDMCMGCHDANTIQPQLDKHANRNIEVAIAPRYKGVDGSYAGNSTPGSPYGNCVNTYCHSNGTHVSTGEILSNSSSTWGTVGPLGCGTCHGYPPNYVSGSPKANTHSKHSASSCNKCHSMTTADGTTIANTSVHVNKQYDLASGPGVSFFYTYNAAGGACNDISCHSNGTATWGGTIACGGCHAVTNQTLTTGSHATHLSTAVLRGPNAKFADTVTCDTCHGAGAAAGTHNGHGNGTFANLSTIESTTACDGCHSPDGAFNGVKTSLSSNLIDTSIGAKDNWAQGVYSGNNLAAGKEKWCIGCHDSGTSIIATRQAPNLAGDNTTYGYYVAGHGGTTTDKTECGGCHDPGMNHNLDGLRTYASVSNNYQQGYRLISVGGNRPMNIPKLEEGCGYDRNDYALCFSCHNNYDSEKTERLLLSDTKAEGVYSCTTNNYKNASSITTGFRNVSLSGYKAGDSDVPANIHWDHLVDIHNVSLGSAYWDSDRNGYGDSKTTCVTCHNPHGAIHSVGTDTVPTVRMTRQGLDIYSETTATLDYGMNGPNSYFPCLNCHLPNTRYYRNATAELPAYGAVSLADKDPNDPSAADTWFTNKTVIQVTLTAYGTPTEMILAENPSFSTNSTGWVPFVSRSTYTLLNIEGEHTVYAKVRNTLNDPAGSESRSTTITLDRTSPTVTPGITYPNLNTVVWNQGTNQSITWSGASDTNLKNITMTYSTDGGATYPNVIAAGLPNTGSYAWNPVPLINSANVRVRMVVADRAGNQTADASNEDFTIQAIPPVISSLTATDGNSADPAPAEPGYTNKRAVTVNVSGSNYPTEMTLAETASFTTNSTGWISFNSSATYTLTAGDGSKNLFCKLKNATGESAVQSTTIILDTQAPELNPEAITAPTAATAWAEGGSQIISWNISASAIQDDNIKDNPISLGYVLDSRLTNTITINTGQPNTGTYAWNPVPKPATYRARLELAVYDKAGNRSAISSAGDFLITTPYLVTTATDTGAGSLRDVLTRLIAANGNDTIWFNIPESEFTNGVAVIRLGSKLPVIDQSGIAIDAGSQTLYTGNTNTYGPEVRLHGWSTTDRDTDIAFDIAAADTTIKGFQMTNFHHPIHTNGNNTVIQGNHICFLSNSATPYTQRANAIGIVTYFDSSNALIGGTGPDEQNHIAGCTSDSWYDAGGMYLGGNNHRVVNNMIGLLPNGNALDNGIAASINASSTDSVIQGNQISAPTTGISVSTYRTTIKGNIFGLYYDGLSWQTRSLPEYAIYLSGWTNGNIIIGGPDAAAADKELHDSNVIAAKTTGYGIWVMHDNSQPTRIFGNFIGTSPSAQAFSGGTGIYSSGSYARFTRIGGSGSGEAGNVIAHMTNKGVHVAAGADFVDIRSNSFYANGGSTFQSDDAIYLAAGANNDITRPSIISAGTSAVAVGGVQDGDFVEVYIADHDSTDSGYGEGKTFIGTHIAEGTSVDVPVSGVSIGQWVTATRTALSGSAGNTSAFSSNVLVQ